MNAAAHERGAWLWGRQVDLAVFGGSAALALALAACAPVVALGGKLPEWAWLALVVGLDVAHVWTTLFRTYLDAEELARRRALYVAVPLGCYLVGVLLHHHGAATFWRVLAYTAIFHFVRQQVGWVAIYRARAGERSRLDRWLDDAVVYAATGWPLLYWHAHARSFHWLAPGDVPTLGWLRPLVGPAGVVYLALLAAYAARALERRRAGLPFNAGKHVVVVSTAAVWFFGIVAVDQDYTFTVTNVIVHAVPYLALLWAYARARAEERPRSLVARVVRGGLVAFFSVALFLAFAEEMLWERLVWHDRPGWFGGADRDAPLLSEAARAFVVPLLALPQAVHYVLDGLLWRRKDTGSAQARALGFAPRP
jgi:hypothetical protein